MAVAEVVTAVAVVAAAASATAAAAVMAERGERRSPGNPCTGRRGHTRCRRRRHRNPRHSTTEGMSLSSLRKWGKAAAAKERAGSGRNYTKTAAAVKAREAVDCSGRQDS